MSKTPEQIDKLLENPDYLFKFQNISCAPYPKKTDSKYFSLDIEASWVEPNIQAQLPKFIVNKGQLDEAQQTLKSFFIRKVPYISQRRNVNPVFEAISPDRGLKLALLSDKYNCFCKAFSCYFHPCQVDSYLLIIRVVSRSYADKGFLDYTFQISYKQLSEVQKLISKHFPMY